MGSRTYACRIEVLVVAKSKAHAAETIDSFLGDETVMDHRIVDGPEVYKDDSLMSWRKPTCVKAQLPPLDGGFE